MNALAQPQSLKVDAGSEAQWASLPTFIRQVCTPIKFWLQDSSVVEIMVNRPGEVWVEAVGRPMERFEVPELTREAIISIAERIAGHTGQSVNEETPLLSAAMPHGERFQGVLAPAAPIGGAFSIRKQVISDLSLDDYQQMGALDHVKVSGPRDGRRGGASVIEESDLSDVDEELAALLQDTSPAGVAAALRFAVKNAVTMLISGGTSSGKTTFLNALLREVPFSERVISIEDTRELKAAAAELAGADRVERRPGQSESDGPKPFGGGVASPSGSDFPRRNSRRRGLHLSSSREHRSSRLLVDAARRQSARRL